MSKKLNFPKNFVWGTATSSFQIEGAKELRGESIWDRFATQPGAIKDGSDGSRACSHYELWPEDVKIMQNIGVNAYRFSISWPRIQPNGRGAVKAEGLDFYNRLVDGLLAANITPWITLYHWDLPQALEDEGGWRRRGIVDDFAEYTNIVVDKLGDRVKHWITHNEPWCASVLGHQNGMHAPGLKSWPATLQAAHHILLSHGRAVQQIRSRNSEAQCGITLNLCPAYPASASKWDQEATRLFDGGFNRWYLDPLYAKQYPQDMIQHYLEKAYVDSKFFDQLIQPGDYEEIASPCDFLGINYYSRGVIRSDQVPEEQNEPRIIAEASDENKTDIGWEVFSQGLSDLLLRVHNDYQPGNLYITENGAAYHCSPDKKGEINDQKRIDYIESHIEAIDQARNLGAPVQGYFVWSLMDNFEWQEGYTQRFGMVWVDYETMERTLKASANWYRQFIASQRQV